MVNSQLVRMFLTAVVQWKSVSCPSIHPAWCAGGCWFTLAHNFSPYGRLSEPAPSRAPSRMDGNWTGNAFLLGSSSLANHQPWVAQFPYQASTGIRLVLPWLTPDWYVLPFQYSYQYLYTKLQSIYWSNTGINHLHTQMPPSFLPIYLPTYISTYLHIEPESYRMGDQGVRRCELI